MIPEGVKVSAGDVMINLNLSKTLDGTWLLSYRPLDKNPSPASGSAFYKWISLLYHPPCGASEREVVEHFCAVTVSLSGLSAVAPTLHVRASPSPAEEQCV